jgi:hypothetical protein
MSNAMTEEKLVYNPSEYDRVEGLAQDTLPFSDGLESAKGITVMLEDGTTRDLQGRELEFIKSVNPNAVIKMVVIIRRLRYLYEKLNEDASLLNSEASKMVEAVEAEKLEWAEERLRLMESLALAASESGKGVDDYLLVLTEDEEPPRINAVES